MLDKDRIRLMTGLAIYSKHGGQEDLKIAGNYRYDYLMTQLFSAFVRFTLCYVAAIFLYLLCSSNDFFVSINTNGFIRTVKGYFMYYILGLVLYLAVSAAVYILRYKRAVENTEVYAEALDRLDRKYLKRRKG